MQRGYIRLSKAGPSLEEQQDALRSVGITDFSDDGPVYVDIATKRKQKPGDVPLKERAKAVNSCRKGDMLVIESASRLATSAEDALQILAELGRKDATLFVVSTGREYHWSPAAAEGLELASLVASENRAEVTAKARAAATALRKPPKLTGKLEVQAKALWADPKLSAADVEREIGVPVRTLYRKFGARGTPVFGGSKKR